MENEDEKLNEFTPLVKIYAVDTRHHHFYHSRQYIKLRFVNLILILLLILSLPIVLMSLCDIQLAHRNSSSAYRELQSILLATPSEEKAREWSSYYTSGPHLAGANYSQASWTRDRWLEFGITAEIVAYDAYLNYPLGHRLALYQETDAKSWTVKYEASLTEDVIKDDPTTALQNSIPTFHGYSASGNVTAPYVYVNYGTNADFEDLIRANISLVGKIALARYGLVFRGLKVKRAQELGMTGVLIYTDPGDDGVITEENGMAAYPEGPARQPSSVQRGSNQFISTCLGDPTTPGYPSIPGAPRQPVENSIPSIPSLPISYLDAIPLLTALNGHGPAAKDINIWWQRNLGLKRHGINYNVGPSPPSLVLNLVNKQDYVITPIWDVIGVINGTKSDEVIILGNHRDAWIAGGAADPNSGSAALNEVIRSFGVALSRGWKPRRTIVFASWDGEEYGLIGSTEWVEDHLPWLSASAIAYLNVDIGTSGTKFVAKTSPLLDQILHEITSLVLSPNQTIPGQTVADLWNSGIKTIGSGSDFTAFQDLAGIPCFDLGFKEDTSRIGEEGNIVYHYHSNYDSFHWMNTYGDPGFYYHTTMAKLLALLTAKLVEMPVIPLNATDYALALNSYLYQNEARIEQLTSGPLSENELVAARTRPTPGVPSGSLSKLKSLLNKTHLAVNQLELAARNHDAWAADLAEKVKQDLPWWKWPIKLRLCYQIKKVNDKYKYLERSFLYGPGLDGRPSFKHVVFAPDIWAGYSGAVFPGLSESIDKKDWANAERWVGIIKGCIMRAEKILL
ncbi:putative glutamate carboxypeptidase [Erysiphe neolycopersici]|uniref:Putative glutamate carboxypeptidase n=1 Tax=Erysiphe neolycopersici TaxID=212602 RepID=A0A420HHJ6_9PEZI|nr:putative glutamate carboxypeptidase [Erysiphe neolycopersici]